MYVHINLMFKINTNITAFYEVFELF